MREWMKISKKYAVRFLTGLIAFVIGIVCYGGCHKEKQDFFSPLETMGVAETLFSYDEDIADVSGDTYDSAVVSDDTAVDSEKAVYKKIYVYVCGCVNNPGVYVFDEDARIFEAVEAAGGMTDEAAAGSINLAGKLEDQMQVYVPSCEEVFSDSAYPGKESDFVSGGQSLQDTEVLMININTATASELDTLPGIGVSKALDIINYREAHGAFTKIEELMNIPGIKSGVFDKIKDLVTVD